MRIDGDEYNGKADHPRCPAAPGLYVFIILQQAFVLLAFVSLLTTTIDGKREFGLPSELHERLRGTGFLKREFDLPVGLQTQVLCGADSAAQQRFLHDLNKSRGDVLISQELLPACGNPLSARGGGANFPPTGVSTRRFICNSKLYCGTTEALPDANDNRFAVTGDAPVPHDVQQDLRVVYVACSLLVSEAREGFSSTLTAQRFNCSWRTTPFPPRSWGAHDPRFCTPPFLPAVSPSTRSLGLITRGNEGLITHRMATMTTTMNRTDDDTTSLTTYTTKHFGLITQLAAAGFISLSAYAERDGTVNDFYGHEKHALHSNMPLALRTSRGSISMTSRGMMVTSQWLRPRTFLRKQSLRVLLASSSAVWCLSSMAFQLELLQ